MDEAMMREIERSRQAGAVIILKWDGERSERIYTVILEHHAKQFMFRTDTDDMFSALQEALRQFWEAIT